MLSDDPQTFEEISARLESEKTLAEPPQETDDALFDDEINRIVEDDSELSQVKDSICTMEETLHSHEVARIKDHRGICRELLALKDEVRAIRALLETFVESKSASLAPAKVPVKAPAVSEKAPVKAPVKAPHGTPVKAPEGAPVKAPEGTPVKAPEGAPVKAPEGTPVKAPEGTPVKALKSPAAERSPVAPLKAGKNLKPTGRPGGSEA